MTSALSEKILDTALYAGQLFVELAVLFILISALVGALQIWLPAEKTRHYLSARHGHGYLIGALIGAATPFCSCSTVPLTLGLLRSGAGFGPTMTLLFTSPLVNPIIVTLFFITFGLELTLLYTGMAISMALIVSWLMDRAGFERYLRRDLFQPAPQSEPQSVTVSFDALQPKAKVEGACCSAPAPSTPDLTLPIAPDVSGLGVMQPVSHNINRRMATARRLLVEATTQFRSFLPHVAIGVLIGAVAHGFVPDTWLVTYAGGDNLWAIPIAALVGVPLYVRGSTMIPIALTLTAKGMGIGAVIALVIGGAGASLPEMIMLKRMFHWPIMIAFLVSVFGIAISTGLMAQIVL
ncbi:permease [Sedimenticola selenatireducens]|jgi:hypothetical protein|uniref:Permease n=1 Tax=Sedimenticola selenatireducens TaxID=191960 RepID=A0A558DIQ0_9GAMM|nr:permease [Sedimenticola selenatireducens]TVO69015.1 permease [Sedimenticola selenatireducens]TVT60899.1 MAG: permease [Sedimenticola selenatireducens]